MRVSLRGMTNVGERHIYKLVLTNHIVSNLEVLNSQTSLC